MLNFKKIAALLSVFAVVACSEVPVKPASQPPVQSTIEGKCSNPRPEMCTMEYNPVCGTDAKGLSRSYGNACSACGNAQVQTFTRGECHTK